MIIYPLLVLTASACWAFQPLINARLAQGLDSPIWASFISFAVGTTLLLIVGLIMNGRFMVMDIAAMKWWMFIGGALGAVGVTVAIYAVPHIGVLTLVALLIAGQLVFSAILDHYGVLLPAPNPITWQKFAGMILLGAGAMMTLKG